MNRQEGATWGRFCDDGCSSAEDAYSHDDEGNRRGVQVTAVLPKHTLRHLAQNDAYSEHRSVDDLIADVWAAVERKAGRYPQAVRGTLVLALDVIRAPAHARDDVVQGFRERHGATCASKGFRAVWLVGPLAASRVDAH